jgi:hypothetical protein
MGPRPGNGWLTHISLRDLAVPSLKKKSTASRCGAWLLRGAGPIGRSGAACATAVEVAAEYPEKRIFLRTGGGCSPAAMSVSIGSPPID